MSFEEEVVVVHRGCKHGCKRAGRFVCFDRGCKNNHIGLDVNLPVQNQIASLNIKSTIALWCYLTNHTLNIVNSILFNCTAVEFIKEFTRSADINIEYITVSIRIVVAGKNSVLGSIHTAYLRAVFVTLGAICRTAGTNTLNKYDCLWFFAVARALKMTVCWSRCVTKAFKLK